MVRRAGRQRAAGLLLLFALTAWGIAVAPSSAVAAGGVWKGTAEGIRVNDHETQSGELTVLQRLQLPG